jgi:hypothetical protein
MPQLERYCGLSGILNALLAAGLIQLWRETRDRLLPLVGIGAVLKILVEAAAGAAVFTHTAWPSVPVVHAVGLTAGAIIVCASLGRLFGAVPNRRNTRLSSTSTALILGRRRRRVNLCGGKQSGAVALWRVYALAVDRLLQILGLGADHADLPLPPNGKYGPGGAKVEAGDIARLAVRAERPR